VESPQSAGPNFSHLSNVTIAPGQELRFVLYSINLSLGIGSTQSFRTYNQLHFGDPIFGGWESDQYTFTATVGDAFSISDPEAVSLTRFSSYVPPSTVPDSGGTLLLLSVGLTILFLASIFGFLMTEADPTQHFDCSRHQIPSGFRRWEVAKGEILA
jgi:hypothetical protein